MSLQESFENQGNWLFRRRGFLPVFIFLFAAILFVRSEFYPNTIYLQDGPYEDAYDTFCLLVTLFGLGIRMFTIGYADRNTSGRNVHGQIAESVNVTGIYSIVRHPLYLGNFFMWLGIIMLSMHAWFVLIYFMFFWIYYERIMFAEEQFLKRKFGEVYHEWAKKTPAFFPRFSQYVHPRQTFSWRRVLRNEKTGILLVFVSFTLFHIAGEWIEGGLHFSIFLIVMAVLSALLYGLIKVLQKKTHLFHDI